MKTTTIISVLSLALIITFANAGFAKNGKSDGSLNPTVKVKYQVTVNLNLNRTLCNTYQVEILDANGRLVAPAQIFVPGTDSYTFEEQTRQTAGIRIARLVLVIPGDDRYMCQQELFTSPDVHLVNFIDGQAYFFNLYPTPGQPK